jgi:REP element-mobilizing transposase RayT
MARLARAEIFDPTKVSTFHCVNRCVRQCFLCGADPLTGKDYEHRKAWIEERLVFLAGCFGIDVLGFSVMSNHFHVVLRNRPDVVETWSDADVARRWYRLCPARKHPDGSPAEPNDAELNVISQNPQRLAEIRRRLSDISWFMRMVSERVARQANAEDNCSGRFWQGRFKAVKLCDEAALLACMIYVDLNPIRAGLCHTPETSAHTSARRRIEESRKPASNERSPADWLAPLELNELEAPGPQPSVSAWRASDKGCLPMTQEDYLSLLDWTGRRVARGKRGVIPSHLEPILTRLGITEPAWLTLATGFGELFRRVAGSACSLHREAAQHGRRWYQAPGRHLLGAA